MAKDPYIYLQPEVVGRLKNLNILARQAVEGFLTGLHKSPHKGFSVEFSEHREYTPGDDLRHLDWVAYGRSDRFYIKQYEQETNLRATILLDVSGSMGYRQEGPISKFAYGCFLTACLATLMTRQADAVGVVGFDDDIRFQLPPASTPSHLDRLFKLLEVARPGRDTAIAEVFHNIAPRLKKRGLVIVISDLYDEPEAVLKALQHFVHRRHQVMLFHVLDDAERTFPFKHVTKLKDMETGERLQVDPRSAGEAYRREIEAFIERYRRECAERRMEYIQVSTSTPYDRMLMDYLMRRKNYR